MTTAFCTTSSFLCVPYSYKRLMYHIQILLNTLSRCGLDFYLRCSRVRGGLKCETLISKKSQSTIFQAATSVPFAPLTANSNRFYNVETRQRWSIRKQVPDVAGSSSRRRDELCGQFWCAESVCYLRQRNRCKAEQITSCWLRRHGHGHG